MSSITLELTSLTLNLVRINTMESGIVFLKLACENHAFQVFRWGILSCLLLNLVQSRELFSEGVLLRELLMSFLSIVSEEAALISPVNA
jgi:hypothetical protein